LASTKTVFLAEATAQISFGCGGMGFNLGIGFLSIFLLRNMHIMDIIYLYRNLKILSIGVLIFDCWVRIE